MNTKQMESDLTGKGFSRIVGIDEAGRGPLAGPVVAAAVHLPLNVVIPNLKDSKMMTARQRELCFVKIMEEGIVGIGQASPKEIDQINVLQASFLAMARAVDDLGLNPDICLVDGNQTLPDLAFPQQAIVRGDQLCFAIAAASVVAKVSRDRLMVDLDAEFPQYGFAQHKGYPTKAHKLALEQWGPSPIHRLSFAGAATKESWR